MASRPPSFPEPAFKHAPPRFHFPATRLRHPALPYPGAPPWECSVYFYWWHYLRRSANYRNTCENSGKGNCAALYRDFGNIFSGGFALWWQKTWHLFAEPPAVVLAEHANQFNAESRVIDIKIDISKGARAVEAGLLKLHRQLAFPDEPDPAPSSARYPVARRPVLTNLHRQLVTYDLRVAYPDMPDEAIADRLGRLAAEQLGGVSRAALIRQGLSTTEIDHALRRAKRKMVQHDLRCARRLIENVELGVFPVHLT